MTIAEIETQPSLGAKTGPVFDKVIRVLR